MPFWKLIPLNTKISQEITYPRQSATSCGTRSVSLWRMTKVEAAETAWEETTMRDCSLSIEAFVLPNFSSPPPLYFWLCSAADFFSCSMFKPSLAYIKCQINPHVIFISHKVKVNPIKNTNTSVERTTQLHLWWTGVYTAMINLHFVADKHNNPRYDG